MYTAGAQHPNKRASEQFMNKIAVGDIRACASTEMLQEILHRYSSVGRMDLACAVYDQVVAACPEILGVEPADLHLARDILRDTRGISARDAVHAAVMLNNGIEWIASFDRHFDRIPGIKRLEPA